MKNQRRESSQSYSITVPCASIKVLGFGFRHGAGSERIAGYIQRPQCGFNVGSQNIFVRFHCYTE
jgi:hypothetical protein